MTDQIDQPDLKRRRRFHDKQEWCSTDQALKAISYHLCHPNKNKVTWAAEKLLIHFILRATKKDKLVDLRETRWESRVTIAEHLGVPKHFIRTAERQLQDAGLIKCLPIYEGGERVGRSIALTDHAIKEIKDYTKTTINKGSGGWVQPTQRGVEPTTQVGLGEPNVGCSEPNVGLGQPIEVKTMESKTRESKIMMSSAPPGDGQQSAPLSDGYTQLEAPSSPANQSPKVNFRGDPREVELVMNDLIKGKEFVDYKVLIPIYRIIASEFTADELRPFTKWYVNKTMACDWGQIRLTVTKRVWNERNGAAPTPEDYLLYIRNQYNMMHEQQSN